MTDQIHRAATPVGNVQRCGECGKTLVDYSIGESVTVGHAAGFHLNEARPLFFKVGAKVLEVGRGIQKATSDAAEVTCGR